MIVGSLVNAIAQIAFSEGMAENVIAITAIPIATLVDPATAVIMAIVAVAVVLVVVAVVIPTTIMTIVFALMVVWWVVVARATLVG
jgi:ABC-type dipeptide/oligopeptide/nickel transport system permease subunit